MTSPLLVIHGEEDQVIPLSNGQRLFELSPSEDKTFLPVPGAGHNDLFLRKQFNLPTLLLDLWPKPGEADAR
jgi:fermentation-respiration switch protein FrsA (DUF1100 family)